MKTAANVFAIIGMVANTLIAILESTLMELGAFVVFYWVIAIICFIVGGSVIASTEKKVGLGVAAILFVNPLCGIFYLCWDGR